MRQLQRAQDGTAARYFEPRSGLSLTVPGDPTLVSPDTEADGLLVAAVITLAELPVTITVQLADAAPQPGALGTYLRLHAEPRAQGTQPPRIRIHQADAAQRARWGVVAAVSTRYRLQAPTLTGEDAEEVLVLMPAGLPGPGPGSGPGSGPRPPLVVLSKSFVLHKTPPVGWALLSALLSASLRFSAEPPSTPIDPVWPSSDILRPGLAGALTPPAAARAAALGLLWARLGAPQRRELHLRAARLLTGSEPGGTPLSAQDRLLLVQLLADACDGAEAEDIVTAAAEGARTTHDVRGLGVMLLTALGRPERDPESEAANAADAAGAESDDALSLYAN